MHFKEVICWSFLTCFKS